MKSSSTEAEGERAPVADRLWVVLPIYNEAAAIERVVEEWIPVLTAADPAFVLLVIDDGSTDATPEALQRLAARDSRLRVVRQSNQGHGAACRRGYEIATAASSDADWVLQIDSDGQCDPHDFPALWHRRQGSAALLGRRRRREDGALRTVTSRILALAVSVLAGRWIPDPNVPFRLFRREALARVLERLPPSSSAGSSTPERPVELYNAALSVATAEILAPQWIEIHFRRRLIGESHYRFGRMGRLAVGLLAWQALGRDDWRGDTRGRSQGGASRRWGGAAAAWIALAAAVAVYGWHHRADETIWYDEAMQVYSSLGIDAAGELLAPPGGLRAVISRNRADQLDPGEFSILLHYWMRLTGTAIPRLRLFCGALALAGLAAFAALCSRWWPHPLTAPAAIGLALLDPLVRAQAIEVRPYALEIAGAFLAFWATDRFLACPTPRRALATGAAYLILLGSRYSAFLAVAALATGLLLAAFESTRRDGDPAQRREWMRRLTLVFLPPLLGAAVIAHYSLPGLLARSSYQGGRLVSYLAPLTLKSLSPLQALSRAGHNLVYPATLALTLSAGLALWPRRSTLVASRFVRRVALVVLILTAVLWRWHPWDPATKWNLYLHLVSLVCLARLAADVLPTLQRSALGRQAAGVLSIAVIAGGAWLTATYQRRPPWDVALPALHRVTTLLGQPGKVAVGLNPMPIVRYYYEFGSLRGRPEYPQRFLFPQGGLDLPAETLTEARWFISFDALPRLAERYPTLAFSEDAVADQLLWVAPRSHPGNAPTH
jgi:hypothetical protein